MSHKFPDFFVIGTARAGTTSLYHYLSQHPQVFLPRVKEPKYFCFANGLPRWAGPGDKEAISTYTFADKKTYLSLFNLAASNQLSGDITPWYMYSKDAAESISTLVPESKLICILRDPVCRALSNFQINRRTGREPESSFARAMSLERERIKNNWGWTFHYARRGEYYAQLIPYRELFPREQLLIVSFDDLVSNTDITIHTILEFLGLSTSVKINTSERYHSSQPAETTAPVARRLLGRFRRKHNLTPDSKLRNAIGKNLRKQLYGEFEPGLQDLAKIWQIHSRQNPPTWVLRDASTSC